MEKRRLDGGSPIALFGPAQFFSSDDFSDDEEVVAMRQRVLRWMPIFLTPLPSEIVESKIWPLIMDSGDVIQNYRLCTALRCVCVGWKNFVERTPQWSQGSLSWALLPYLDSDDSSVGSVGSISDISDVEDEL